MLLLVLFLTGAKVLGSSTSLDNWSENKEQLLVYKQVWTNSSTNECLNINCTQVYGHQGKNAISPDKMDLQILGKKCGISNSNNNNKYKDSRRDLPQDAGMEIVFVLDGSGSINFKDFRKAKDFIKNVMQTLWTTCFDCRFAVVQYARNIRTELSLNENSDHHNALHKVWNITQLNGFTRTASAIYHVLTEVFVPQSGSKEKATKIIILLSDGQMAGDNRTLTAVLNMPQMEGVVRYAIGVGPEVIHKRQAMQEMTEIAGSEDRLLKIANYVNLESIISSMVKSIMECEGPETGKEMLQFCLSSDPQSFTEN